MADVETTTSWANLLREMKGPLVEALRWKTVLLAEVKRDKSPRRWQGKQITIPIILAPQQSTGMLSNQSTGTLNNPHNIDDVQANITTAIIHHVISFSTQVLQQARGDDTSWAQVLPLKMRMAEDGISRTMNEQMCGPLSGTAGDQGMLAAITDTANSLACTVGATANLYQFYPGRICDIRTRTTGALVTGGNQRKIASVNRTTGVITFDTAAYGGDSGNINHSNLEGVFIEGGGFTTAAGQYALQGLGQAVATTGTFQGVNKATYPAWQGTDATPSSASDPTISIFDKAERLTMQLAGSTPDFYLCDPAVIDKYTQGLTVQARWAGDEAKLQSGFTGVSYRNKVLVPEFDMPASTAYGISREDCALYTLDDGPDWDRETGSMLQRFSNRSLPVEAWLVWLVQFGFQRCNAFCKIGSLNQAS